jgi:uncharacterized protein YjiS (DUF1127 family)
MSHHQSDPAHVAQFRRRWSEASPRIKLLGEMSEHELDRLAIERGERIVRRLPHWLVAPLSPQEREELAAAFGRPLLRRRLRQRMATKTGNPDGSGQ